MKQFIIFFSIFFIFFSCEDTEICEKGNETPKVFIKFKDAKTNKGKIIENIIIDRLDKGEIQKDSITKISKDSLVLIPLSLINENTTLFLYPRKSTNKTEIKLNYKIKQEYISKACGFRIVYTDLNHQLIQKGFIDSIQINSNSILNETTQIFTIFL